MPLAYKTFSEIITFTRASTATYTDSAGVLQTAAADAPRFNYNPTTLDAQGFLVEEGRTNSLTYSEQFDNVIWGKTATTITANSTTAPNGAVDADSEIENTATSAHSINQSISFTAGTTYTVSVFAKEIPGSAKRYLSLIFSGTAFTVSLAGVFDLGAGTNTAISTNATANILPIGNGWYRCSITAVATVTTPAAITIRLSNVSTSGLPSYTGDGTSGLYIWGAQTEAGAFATSYIPTTTAAVTRAADLAVINTTSPWFNATEGTIFSQWNSFADSVQRYTLTFVQAASTSTRIDISVNSANTVNPRTVVSGAAVATISGGTYTVNTTAKNAFAYAFANYASSLSGASAIQNSNAGALPTSLTRMFIGSQAGVNYINGYLQRITYYPRRLTNAELQALTA